MLGEIGRPENVQSAVDKAKDKESGFRLMGFGHRVYKNFDPRAKIIREMTYKVPVSYTHLDVYKRQVLHRSKQDHGHQWSRGSVP